MPVDEVEKLIKEKELVHWMISYPKKDKFSAILQLDDDYKANFVFENDEEQATEEIEQAKTAPTIQLCERTLQTERVYAVQQSQENAGRHRSFRITRKLLDKEIPPEEFLKLVSEKKTGLIKGFVSMRTKRPFDANLILKDDGGIGFEFLPQENQLNPEASDHARFSICVLNGKDPKRLLRSSTLRSSP